MATSQSRSEQPFCWTEIMIKALITVWREADIQRIMDGKTKKELVGLHEDGRKTECAVHCLQQSPVDQQDQVRKKHSSSMGRKPTEVVQGPAILKMSLTLVVPQYLAATQVNELLSRQFRKPGMTYPTSRKIQCNRNPPLPAINRLNFNWINTGCSIEACCMIGKSSQLWPLRGTAPQTNIEHVLNYQHFF